MLRLIDSLIDVATGGRPRAHHGAAAGDEGGGLKYRHGDSSPA